jgi:hypothetical protein
VDGSSPELHEQYTRARNPQSHVAAEQAISEAMKATAKNAHAARLRFDALRWYAGKLNPKVYGDRLEHAGSIDVNIGLADRLERARQPVIEATAEAVVTALCALPSATRSGKLQLHWPVAANPGLEGPSQPVIDKTIWPVRCSVHHRLISVDSSVGCKRRCQLAQCLAEKA